MSILQLPHDRPDVILIDWHATLVDTHDAMYHAIDDVLPKLKELDLWDRLLTPEESKTIEDAKLLLYVRNNLHLHPKITAQRKISRTDIFEVLFGGDQDAKGRAHQAFDSAYKKYVEEVFPLEDNIPENVHHLQQLGVLTGIISNRKREFLEHEIALVENGDWHRYFDVIVCGSDVARRKPAPDMLLRALERLNRRPSSSCWYVGDSTTDVIAAKEAGVTSIFYNGAGWGQSWLDKIFPNTTKHPHRPDAVVNSIDELTELARHLLAQHKRVERARPVEPLND